MQICPPSSPSTSRQTAWGCVERHDPGKVGFRFSGKDHAQIRVGREPRSGDRGGIRKRGCVMFQGTFDLEMATPIDASALSDVLFERGMYWASGRSGLVDLVAAHKWFNLAALKGRKDAVTLRQEVAGQMSDAEISAAQ